MSAPGRKPDFGVDAPYVPLGFGLAAAVSIAFAVVAVVHHATTWVATAAATAVWFAACAASYLYTTRAGKLRVWSDLARGAALRGDERVLDVGCGRGVVLLTFARLLPRGEAVGVDLWRSHDQSGNDERTTRRNAELAGVAERIHLHTGDMRELPFPDGSFDLVVSSLAIHNVPDRAGRDRAIEEIFRAVKPGGRILVADFQNTADYESRLRAVGAADVKRTRLGWRFWYGGPFAATTLVEARKPA